MATPDELRSIVLALPETTEGTHFRQPVYRVSDKPFLAIEKDNLHVTARLTKQEIQAFVSDNPVIFDEVWQSGKHLIGIRFALDKVSKETLRQIIEQSWRTKAPKKLIKS
jgi:hypothetical protein